MHFCYTILFATLLAIIRSMECGIKLWFLAMALLAKR